MNTVLDVAEISAVATEVVSALLVSIEAVESVFKLSSDDVVDISESVKGSREDSRDVTNAFV